jgi:hypothetical protein
MAVSELRVKDSGTTFNGTWRVSAPQLSEIITVNTVLA